MWLLEESVFQRMESALVAGWVPDAQEQLAFNESMSVSAQESRILSVAGETARVDINGVLTDTPNFFAALFGGGNTAYPDIIQAISMAEADPSVSSIDFTMNSPGGTASALWMAVMEAIAGTTKPTRAIVTNAQSATYGLASQTDTIVAFNGMASVGSVGVVAKMRVDESIIEITSTNAQKKRPDPETEEGRAVVVEFLDQIEAEFIGAIGRGRNKDKEEVIADFGQGASFLAAQAIERGMIDGVLSVDPVVPTTRVSSGNNQSGAIKMDLNTLKAEHPSVYADAVQVGATHERNRVAAHLDLGAASGAMDIATKAIEEGIECDSNMQSKYLAAKMRKSDVEASAADDDEIASAADNTPQGGDDPNAESFEDKIVSALEDQMGLGEQH